MSELLVITLTTRKLFLLKQLATTGELLANYQRTIGDCGLLKSK